MGIENNDNLTDEERELLAEHEEEIAGADGDDDLQATEEPAAPVEAAPVEAVERQDVQQPISLDADASDAKAALDMLTAEKTGLREAYANGDLERDEYDRKLDELNDKMLDARLQVKQAEMYEDISRQTLAKQWNGAVGRFLAKPENAVFKEDGPLNTALDAEVRKMNANEMDKYPDHAERLAEARRRVVVAAESIVGRKQAAPRKPLADIPPSVDDIPPAGDEVDSEFAHLDRLEGMKFDSAFARLTPEQRDRYLSAS